MVSGSCLGLLVHVPAKKQNNTTNYTGNYNTIGTRYSPLISSLQRTYPSYAQERTSYFICTHKKCLQPLILASP